MSIGSALNNALTGLTATSRMAEVVSSNLSNVLTEGYGRRSVELAASQVGGAGGGVQVTGITRFADAGLLADRRLADAALGGQEREAAVLLRLEQMLGGPEDAAGIGARLAALEKALISAASDPASETRLTEVVARLADVARTLQINTKEIQSLREESDAMIARDVDTLNTALVQVDAINRDILRVKSLGQDPSALLDARQRFVDQIARIVPIRETLRDNGTISLMTTNGTNLLDSRPAQFGFSRTPTITADMTFASGALGGLTLDGVPLDPLDPVGRLGGGSLGSVFALRDGSLVTVQAGLDRIAVDLVARFQDPATDPTLAPGDPGLLTDQGAPLDLTVIEGLAGRIALNPTIDPAQGGAIHRLRDGLNAATPGPAGSAAQLDRLLMALGASRTDQPGAPLRNAAERAADFTATVGRARLGADESLGYATARRDALHEAELANGVDTDQELQILMRVEKAYAANAKVIQAVDNMLQQLMEI